MKFYKHKEDRPHYGQFRIVKRFLFLPKRFPNEQKQIIESRWLETVYLLQVWRRGVNEFGLRGFWATEGFADNLFNEVNIDTILDRDKFIFVDNQFVLEYLIPLLNLRLTPK